MSECPSLGVDCVDWECEDKCYCGCGHECAHECGCGDWY